MKMKSHCTLNKEKVLTNTGRFLNFFSFSKGKTKAKAEQQAKNKSKVFLFSKLFSKSKNVKMRKIEIL